MAPLMVQLAHTAGVYAHTQRDSEGEDSQGVGAHCKKGGERESGESQCVGGSQPSVSAKGRCTGPLLLPPPGNTLDFNGISNCFCFSWGLLNRSFAKGVQTGCTVPDTRCHSAGGEFVPHSRRKGIVQHCRLAVGDAKDHIEALGTA